MKVIHDGDGAYEDAMALCLLLLNCELLAVTVTHGESHVEIGAANMELLCHALRPDNPIPVAYGVDKSYDGKGIPYPDYIREEADDVLGGLSLPALPVSGVSNSAVELLYKVLNTSDEEITIVATGPLTNIAMLLTTYPEIKDKIERLVIMGGAVNVEGNINDLDPQSINKVAEWNIYTDPKAAAIVFDSNVPILLVPLDITNQVKMNRIFFERIQHEQSPALKITYGMLKNLCDRMGEERFFSQLYFWDSLAAMISIDKTIAQTEKMELRINLDTAKTDLVINSEIRTMDVAMNIENVGAFFDKFIELMQTNPTLVSQPCKARFFQPDIPKTHSLATTAKVIFN